MSKISKKLRLFAILGIVVIAIPITILVLNKKIFHNNLLTKKTSLPSSTLSPIDPKNVVLEETPEIIDCAKSFNDYTPKENDFQAEKKLNDIITNSSKAESYALNLAKYDEGKREITAQYFVNKPNEYYARVDASGTIKAHYTTALIGKEMWTLKDGETEVTHDTLSEKRLEEVANNLDSPKKVLSAVANATNRKVAFNPEDKNELWVFGHITEKTYETDKTFVIRFKDDLVTSVNDFRIVPSYISESHIACQSNSHKYTELGRKFIIQPPKI